MGLLSQLQDTKVEKDGSLIVDIESLVQITDQASGSPKVKGTLLRKGSIRTDRRTEESTVVVDDGYKRAAGKTVTCSPAEHTSVLPLPVPNKFLPCQSPVVPTEPAGEGRCKRFNRIAGIHPRKILLLFATMSSLGTMILIYFTLAINHTGEGM